MRAIGDWSEDADFLVAEAARHGHGDAGRLLSAAARRRPARSGPAPRIEDPQFFDEIRRGLRVSEEMLLPAQADPVLPDPYGPRLVFVPAPAIPSPQPPVSASESARARPALHGMQSSGPLIVALTDPTPYLAAAAAGAAAAARATTTTSTEDENLEPVWTANALRPAILTDMARSRVLPAHPPAQQTAAIRSRDLLHHIQTAAGITTRDLVRRTGMSVTTTSWLLHWLRAQFFVETVAGVHRPGPVLEMASRTDQHELLMQQTLDALRDHLDAAVYLSTYTSGDILIHQSSHSATAPPVRVGAPFSITGHASACGKALLADLDFDARMEHLARHEPVSLTARTITNPRILFDNLDRHGPHAVQFDLLEYSEQNVCAAFSLTVPGHDTACIAVALPADQHHRLIDTAAALSQASTGLLLTRLLTTATTWPTDTTEAPRAIALP
ncbi:IclR family transcriptional regulator C-terminal domain-containing protein [Streptomyces sp. NPDC001553]|uniref:IclR family transcriptional regulator domain-containing protein n=1 Tax=Streptomyces sp. NPDC001553 TaxID=3154385 RepID=UPI003320EB65